MNTRREFLLKAVGAGLAGIACANAAADNTPEARLFKGIGVMRHPVGEIACPDGRVISCQQFTQELLEKMDRGGIIILPSTKDEYGQYLWDFRMEFGEEVKVERKAD